MGSRGAIEVAKTVLEVADVAWTAVECSHHLRHNSESHSSSDEKDADSESLRSENRRLRNLLEQNLVLLNKLSQSPSFAKDCPPDVCPIIFLSVHLNGLVLSKMLIFSRLV